MNQQPQATERPATQPWYKRNASTLVIFAAVLFIVMLQWPMLKGMIYRATGASATNNIEWRTDLSAALIEAREANLPLLVDFTADWCPPCQTMKQDVWPDKQVEELANGSFIPVLIDVDVNQGDALKYRVRSIPTISVLLPDGSEIARAGFMSRSAMRKFLAENAVTLRNIPAPSVEPVPGSLPGEPDEPNAIPASSDLLIAGAPHERHVH